MESLRGEGQQDVLTELEESGLSVEGFAAQLEVPPSWVRYWMEIARLKRPKSSQL